MYVVHFSMAHDSLNFSVKTHTTTTMNREFFLLLRQIMQERTGHLIHSIDQYKLREGTMSARA